MEREVVHIKVKCNIPRIMIAAASSNSGKTTITTSLLQAFSMSGKNVVAYKSGPDYIDPMFHSEVLKISSRNLDEFMIGENNCKYVLCKNSKNVDISIIEGVMGYYDGIVSSTSCSTYELAKLLDCPVVLVLNCKGMAASVCAIIEGFKNFREKSNIKGVILNDISSRLYDYYKNIIESNTDVKVYGYLPYLEECKLESRHLGLVTAQEIGNLENIVKKLGEAALETIDLDGLYELSTVSDRIEYEEPNIQFVGKTKIAVAMDKAFCFYYKDNLDLLEQLGAELIQFSPLSDKELPNDIGGLYMGGGYPELYMKELSSNKSMLGDLRDKINMGLPTFAECGGYMYLLESFKDNNQEVYNLVGGVEGQSYMTKSLENFGYATLTANSDNLMCKRNESINVHEFHYSSSTNKGSTFISKKPQSNKQHECIIADKTKFIGYPHLHFLGNIDFPRNFISKCIEYRKECRDD
ncbi:MAG: cobyrinate a,c-diamide synthase [Sedimentibacter sp.]